MSGLILSTQVLYLATLHVAVYFFIQSQKPKPTEYTLFRYKPQIVCK
jgi:hypothetical protein